MAQTEMMLRLLKDGKIVGYEKRYYVPMDENNTDGEIETDVLKVASFGNIHSDYTGIHFDSFELGIKVGDDWWFDGDIIKYDNKDVGVLKYGAKRGFYIAFTCGYTTLDTEYSLEHIGNIHDNPELLEDKQ